MSKKRRNPEENFNAKDQIEDEDYWLDDEDYYLDDEIDEEDEDYWLDDEEDSVAEVSDVEEVNSEEADAVEETEEKVFSDEKDASDREEISVVSINPDTKELSPVSESESTPEKKKKPKKQQKKKKRQEPKEVYEDEYDEADDAVPKKRSMKKVGIIIGSIAAVLAIAYVGVSVFFMSHFYINTEINGHDFSAKTTADVEAYIKEQVKNYTLTILEKENKTDTIRGEDIDLVYEANSDIDNALKSQNAFLWPAAFFSENSTKVTIDVAYNAEKLETMINSLQSVTAEQIPATSAYPKFNGEQFVVEPEVTGTAVNLDMLHEKINQYISEFQTELDMQKEDCYAMPKYTSESPEVKAACDEMNKYLQASITYTMDENIVVDKTLISNWVTADAELNVTFNEEAVRQWLTEFGDRYDTVGTTRTITTPWGKTAEVSGGTYGWGIDEDTEFTALVNSIKNGEVVTKEPAYYIGQTAASHGPQDWGSTYAEVDLSAQHMWYIVDGGVALETDVVTGVPIPEKETTAGVFNILEMQMNKILVGEEDPETGEPEYETPVTYWMRITWSGIGFHDATWQSSFGGTLYQNPYIGSHGCVNMPYDMAGALYSMISVGTPVIIHY